MNTETLEPKAAAELTKIEDALEDIVLSVSDLDLVGGGTYVGIVA